MMTETSEIGNPICGLAGNGIKKAETRVSALKERMAATYSRGIYKTTTIGNAAFDGRVRNGNGSDHSFKATKNLAVRRQRSEVRIAPEFTPTVPTESQKNIRACARHRSESAFL